MNTDVFYTNILGDDLILRKDPDLIDDLIKYGNDSTYDLISTVKTSAIVFKKVHIWAVDWADDADWVIVDHTLPEAIFTFYCKYPGDFIRKIELER